MCVCGVVVNAFHLSEGSVVFESEVRVIVQVYPSQHGGVVVVWTIHLQSTAESGCYPNLAVAEGCPIMRRSCPGLSNCLQVVVAVIHKRDDASERVGNRQQVTSG